MYPGYGARAGVQHSRVEVLDVRRDLAVTNLDLVDVGLVIRLAVEADRRVALVRDDHSVGITERLENEVEVGQSVEHREGAARWSRRVSRGQ